MSNEYRDTHRNSAMSGGTLSKSEQLENRAGKNGGDKSERKTQNANSFERDGGARKELTAKMTVGF